MEITNINIRRIYDEEKMKAVVSVTLNNSFVVHDMKLIKNKDDYFVAMPSSKLPDGSFRDIAHPIRKEFREEIEREIITKYKEIKNNIGGKR